ncbi:MAG: hypothetical protein IIB99_11610 [Planctomycetes bacterium]|nr:hypothetical protein [Planctomycetota bacterium]MCH8212001.1 hypothetical protein [Planctomycetota bacterium]
MKHRLTKLVVFLLLGAIVNVAVAWASAYWIVPYNGQVLPSQNGVVQVYFAVGDSLPRRIFKELRQPGASTLVWWDERSDPRPVRLKNAFVTSMRPLYEQASPPLWSEVGPTPVASQQIETWWGRPIIECARGWPCLALANRIDLQWNPTTRKYSITKVGSGIPIETHHWPPQKPGRDWYTGPIPQRAVLRYRPIWPGFVINTIFYAAILCLPFAPFQLRRYVRVKRALCIKCGYDLRGNSGGGCPECGWRREDEV